MDEMKRKRREYDREQSALAEKKRTENMPAVKKEKELVKKKAEAKERRYKKSQKANRDRRRNKLKEIRDMKDAFKARGCAICHESAGCCMIYHHARGKKSFNLSVANKRSSAAVKLELEKCECLCWNCHKKLHAGLVELPENEQSDTFNTTVRE